jgi:hypothetical protein
VFLNVKVKNHGDEVKKCILSTWYESRDL